MIKGPCARVLPIAPRATCRKIPRHWKRPPRFHDVSIPYCGNTFPLSQGYTCDSLSARAEAIAGAAFAAGA